MNGKNIPEDCKLVACWSGDGWVLEVCDTAGDCIALLKWPECFGKKQCEYQLEQKGFEIA